jgi:hypothetical protein
VTKYSVSFKSPYRIVATTCCNETNLILLKIEKKRSKRVITQTASALSLNKSLLRQLSPEDAHRIGFIAGYEHAMAAPSHKDKSQKKQSRKSQKR